MKIWLSISLCLIFIHCPSCKAQVLYNYEKTIDTPIQHELRRLDGPCAIKVVFGKGYYNTLIGLTIESSGDTLFMEKCKTNEVSRFACDYCIKNSKIVEFPKSISIRVDNNHYLVKTDSTYKRLIIDKSGRELICTYSNNVSLYE